MGVFHRKLPAPSTGSRLLRAAGAPLLASCLLTALHAPAKAEILTLDCGSANGKPVVTVWVDLDRKQVTERGSANPLATYPATITPMRISYVATDDGNPNGAPFIAISIDRTTGVFSGAGVGANQGMTQGPLSCNRSKTPMPSAKF